MPEVEEDTELVEEAVADMASLGLELAVVAGLRLVGLELAVEEKA